MLSIFILISVASAFARIAHDKNRNRYLWGTIGVVSYFLSNIIAGVIIAMTRPEWLENQGVIMTLDLTSGFLGIVIAYLILKKLPDPTENPDLDNNLLDSQIDKL
jgi:hypothetical protein